MGKARESVVVFDKKNAFLFLGLLFPAILGLSWVAWKIFISMFGDQPVIYFHWGATFAMFAPLVFFPFVILVCWKLRTGGVMPFSVEKALVKAMVYVFAVAFVANITVGAWFFMTIGGRGYTLCEEDVKPLGTSHYAIDKQFCPK